MIYVISKRICCSARPFKTQRQILINNEEAMDIKNQVITELNLDPNNIDQYFEKKIDELIIKIIEIKEKAKKIDRQIIDLKFKFKIEVSIFFNDIIALLKNDHIDSKIFHNLITQIQEDKINIFKSLIKNLESDIKGNYFNMEFIDLIKSNTLLTLLNEQKSHEKQQKEDLTQMKQKFNLVQSDESRNLKKGLLDNAFFEKIKIIYKQFEKMRNNKKNIMNLVNDNKEKLHQINLLLAIYNKDFNQYLTLCKIYNKLSDNYHEILNIYYQDSSFYLQLTGYIQLDQKIHDIFLFEKEYKSNLEKQHNLFLSEKKHQQNQIKKQLECFVNFEIFELYNLLASNKIEQIDQYKSKVLELQRLSADHLIKNPDILVEISKTKNEILSLINKKDKSI